MQKIAEEIAERIIAQRLPVIQKAAFHQATDSLIRALSFDVHSAVRIGFENGADIFYDSKTQKVVADAVINEIKKRLSASFF